ncbi:MAG: type II secretion system F family protein [Ilumatobacteraceae bacterium]
MTSMLVALAAATITHVGCRRLRAPSARRLAPLATNRRFDPHVRRAGTGVAAIAGLLVIGPLLLGAVAAGVVFWRRATPVFARRAQRRHLERSLPDAFDLLVLSIRAGLTPRLAIEALVDAAPDTIGPACEVVIHRVERGHTFADALSALPEILGPGASGLADTIASCERYGLPLEPVLDRLTADARDARRRAAAADARKLPVRLSFPLVICTLPSFVLLAIAPAVIAALSSLGSPAW